MEEIYQAIKHLKGKTIRVKTEYATWSPPITILAMGRKRVHLDVHNVRAFYFTLKAFINMIFDDYKILSDDEHAKYLLSEKDEKLLDI
jgi:hypothetical protein